MANPEKTGDIMYTRRRKPKHPVLLFLCSVTVQAVKFTLFGIA